MPTIMLPTPDRRLEAYTTRDPLDLAGHVPTSFSRVVYSAAHVVADPLADVDPWVGAAIDWDATLRYREHLWDLGFGIAEAMDTAQRGMGLDWARSLELIRRSVAVAKARGGALIASGAGTDHLAPAPGRTLDEIAAAYGEQIEAVEALDGRVILMASRALATVARGPDDYAEVYGRLLAGVREPVILHWLGEMFDPALEGYWGSRDHGLAMETCLAVIQAHADKIDGIKISLLSKEREIEMRRRLPPGVRMYTGDDFNYPELIAGDDIGYSHALLGIFDAIAPVASAALSALGQGDREVYRRLLDPTVPLSRHIFRAPTRFYKTGVVLLAYLNGHQDHFVMIGGQQSARSALHMADLFRLADGAGVLRDPGLATRRMGCVLAQHGIT